jgi:hypothetical protein
MLLDGMWRVAYGNGLRRLWRCTKPEHPIIQTFVFDRASELFGISV